MAAGAAAFLLLVVPVASAQAPYAAPPHYWMMIESYALRENSLEKKATYVFGQRIVLGRKRWERRPDDMRFESLAVLEQFARTLPPETVLEWDPGCVRILLGPGPTRPAPLESVSDQKRFAAFCKPRRIKFIVNPIG